MKNKLLVSVFAMAMAMFAFTSCESKSDVKEVCSDLVKTNLHKSTRSLVQQKGESLTISEYEFPSYNVNDNRLVYRTLSFGNGVYEPKKEDTLTYQYGEWSEDGTQFSLLVNQPGKPSYTLWYRSNAFVTPDGRVIGGEGLNNAARVDKWDKVLASFPNTDWEAEYRGELVLDSAKRDSIKFVPFPRPGHYDTIKVWTGKMDTVSADTTCTFECTFKRDATTYANTGHCKTVSVRTKYNRATAKADTIVGPIVKEYDFNWYFSDVSSDKKFIVVLKNTTPGEAGDELNIAGYKTDDAGKAVSFSIGTVDYKRPANP